MNNQRMWLSAGAMAAALTLGGCWSDDDDDAGSPLVSSEVPDSAGVSTAAFMSFVMSLSSSDESSEPLTIKESFAAPADDSVEPTPLT